MFATALWHWIVYGLVLTGIVLTVLPFLLRVIALLLVSCQERRRRTDTLRHHLETRYVCILIQSSRIEVQAITPTPSGLTTLILRDAQVLVLSNSAVKEGQENSGAGPSSQPIPLQRCVDSWDDFAVMPQATLLFSNGGKHDVVPTKLLVQGSNLVVHLSENLPGEPRSVANVANAGHLLCVTDQMKKDGRNTFADKLLVWSHSVDVMGRCLRRVLWRLETRYLFGGLL